MFLTVMVQSVVPLDAQSSDHGMGERTGGSLYGQAVAAMLDRGFPSSRIEYLLLDAHSKEVVAMRWHRPDIPIPPGSLLKPFIALAYARSQLSSRSLRANDPASPVRFPRIQCHGKSDGCWHADGHGLLGLEQAITVSCNAYFLSLARDVIAAKGNAIQSVSVAYGVAAPPRGMTPPMLIGIMPEWRIAPLALVRAYSLWVGVADTENRDAKDPVDREVAVNIREGMRKAALPNGTAARVGAHPGGVLAKTGTAACVTEPAFAAIGDGLNDRQCQINGDGLVIVAAPAENPRWLLLVRQRGTTGAMTAQVAGEMLTRLEEMNAAR